MRKIYTLCTVLFATLLVSASAKATEDSNPANLAAQEAQFRKEMIPLNTVLMEWDMVRGEWMADNLVNMAFNKPLSQRTFSENYTVTELVDFVPAKDKTKIQQIVAQNRATSTTPTRVSTQSQWILMERTFGREGCNPRSGRTYGDPHISTYDGRKYSFQTVGEFVLSKSRTSSFEVQTRQKASTQDISLNIAAAMNVNGDRVCFYTNEYPDANRFEPIRVNGVVQMVNSRPLTLTNGGIIRRTRSNNYVVSWPTGEKVMISIRKTGRFPFMNVNAEVPSCNDNEYFGLLGNANGNSRDDLMIDGRDDRLASIGFDNDFETIFNGGVDRERERNQQRYISRDFSRVYRVNMMTSLFDYGLGQSTEAFTNLNFPSAFRSISDLNQNQRNRSRRRCEQQGVRGEDLNGCIFDMAFVNISPTPTRPIPSATQGNTLSVIKPTNDREDGINPNGNVDDNNTGSTIGEPDRNKPNTTLANEKEVEPKPSVSAAKPASTEKPATSSKPVYVKPSTVTKPSTSARPNTSPTTRPVRTTPTRTTTPVRTSPTRTSPTRTTPTRTSPTRSTPTRSAPTRSTPSRSIGGGRSIRGGR